MTEPITKQELIDASADALALEQVVNGDDATDVTSRLARTYPTLAKALRLIVENGLLGATAFNLKSEMDASALVNDDYAVVTDDPVSENNGFYQKRSGSWVFLRWNPINQFLTALAAEAVARKLVIDTTDSGNGLLLVDAMQRVWLELSNNKIALGLMSLESGIGDGLYMIDERQRVWLEIVKSGVFMQNLSLSERPDDRATLTDQRQRAIDIAPPQDVYLDFSKPLFGSILCGFADTEVAINVSALLPDRVWQRKFRHIKCAIGATGTTVLSPYYRDGRETLYISTPKLGTTAEMLLYDSRFADVVSRIPLTVATVPDGAGQVLTYFGIGDSITNRQGNLIVKQQLEARGFVVNCVGTMTGVGNQSDVPTGGGGGVLGEGREGWRLTDWTHQTGAKTPVAAGDEATYNANGKATKLGKHPYIRLATGGDAAGDIRNGYILDFAWAWSRFGITTPTDIHVCLTRNDVLAYSDPTLSSLILSEMGLLLRRLRVAAPSARITVSATATGTASNFDAVWASKDVSAYRAIQQAVTALADSKIKYVPAFVYQPERLGLQLDTTVSSADSTSGFITAAQADHIHPQNSSRAALFTAVAAYVGCLAKSLI